MSDRLPKMAASLREAALAIWFGIEIHPQDQKSLIDHGFAEQKSYVGLTSNGLSLVRGEIDTETRLPTERHITERKPLRKG